MPIQYKEVLLLTVHKSGRQAVPCRSTWGSTQIGQEAEGMKEKKCGTEIYGCFLEKKRVRQF